MKAIRKLFSRSRRQEPVSAALSDKPWRKIKGWNKEVLDELKNDIAGRIPETHEQPNVPNINIALTGQIGAGKSSYFNSLNNIFQEEVTGARADVGYRAESLTTQYRVYSITPKGASEPLRWRICDTMGLEAQKPNDAANILKAINGHVPDKFEFSAREINEETPNYIAHPELKDKAHCVAVVVNGKELELMHDDVKQKLKTLRKELGARRTYILLTHIDEACEEVSKDVTTVYHSNAINDLVNKVSRMLDGLPDNQVFPIVNYKRQVDMEDAMDILLLYPLRQMLSSAQNYLKDERSERPGRGYPGTVTQGGQPVRQPSN